MLRVVVPPRFTRGGVPVTPSECRPGTVVQWEVTGEVGVIECFVDPFLVKLIGTGKAVFPALDPEYLQLAPRFLVGGEWTADDELNEAHGHVWFEDGWRFSPADTNNHAPTYLAARQAVERACGIERTG